MSDQFIRHQLLGQVQSQQLGLLGLQTQLSTGQRFQTPGEDPVAALQVIGLKRILARNAQVQTNVATNQSYLGATDSALSLVSSIINDVKGAVQAVVGSTANDAQRKAAAQQTQQALTQLVDTANQQFRGRYLFAGSVTGVKPFQVDSGSAVAYAGNENRVASFGNIDLLFDTNLQGNEVFGAISDPVRGSVDLKPVLTFETRLGDLRHGLGISRGSIAVSDGQTTRVVDLNKAETIGDVARLILANPPSGNTLDVEVGAHGLVIHAASGNLTIEEVGGTTAADLGILTPQGGSGGQTVTGGDLNPALGPTTRLADVLGARARAVLRPWDSHADMIVQADRNGAALNGVTVSIVDDGSVHAGNEKAVFDSGAKTLTIFVENRASTIQRAIDAVNAAHQLDASAMPFTAAMDPLAQRGAETAISVADIAPSLTHDGSGADLDLAHGLKIVNGPHARAIDLSKAATIEDLTNALNSAGIGLAASINASRTGIDVRTRLSGADFSIGENGGSTAGQLGLRTLDSQTPLEQLNYGRGVGDYSGPGRYAEARLRPGGANNDFFIEARNVGPDWDGFTVAVQAVAAGDAEHVDYDPANRTIDIFIRPGTTTANEVIALVNGSAPLAQDFVARLDLRDELTNSGKGTVSPTSATTSGGTYDGADFSITRNDGVTFEIDIHAAKTVGDVIDLINDNAINKDPALGVPLVARAAVFGNGIELVDNSVGTGRLVVTRLNGSNAAVDLGLVPAGQDSRSSPTSGAQPDILTGADVNPQETVGLFTALVRLQQAVLTNDTREIQRAMAMLEVTVTQMNFSRAELGARQQGLDTLQTRLAGDNVELQENLSRDYDADLAQVISDLTLKQAALQASLQATAVATRLSLLDYL